MPRKRSSRKPGWGFIKDQTASFDRSRLVELIHDLYDSSQENKIFLHTRFDCGDDVLAPYKKKLKRVLNPDHFRSDQGVSVSKARRIYEQPVHIRKE